MRLHRYEDFSLLPLRLVMAAIFLFTGITKAFDLAGTAAFFQSLHIPAAVFFAFLVMILEIVGGVCLLLGLFTRYASAWLGIIIVVAIALLHWKQLLSAPERIQFLLRLVLLGGLVTLVFSGAKRPSLDEHFLID